MTEPAAWVDEYGDYLYRFALGKVRHPVTAEDLVQETFLAALRARKNFQGRSSTKTWLIAILKHKIVDHLRRKNRENPTEDMDAFTESADAFFDRKGGWRRWPRKWGLNPMKIYEQKEFLNVLYRCLSELPPRPANVFMLREVDGLSTAEICKELGISTTNTWTILHRARMQLRRCLEINWLDAPG